MATVLTIIFWFVLSFTAMDYTLGRATIKDPFRIIIAVAFAVLFIVVAQHAFN